MTKSLIILEQESVFLHLEMRQPFINVVRQVGSSSGRIYLIGARAFNTWLLDHGYTLETVDRETMILYKSDLSHGDYKTATAARMWSIARQLLLECYHSGKRTNYPLGNVKGFSLDDESPHIALSLKQVQDILENINRSTLKGKRDYALFLLLVSTGIRRKECEQIVIGDFFTEQGHTMLMLPLSKGGKRRKVKVPVKSYRAIEDYIVATERTFTSLSDPLFIGFDRGQHPINKKIGERTIERIVITCGQLIGIEHLTPHDLRTTFNTLAKKGGASLEQRQRAMGHKRPETTQRYDKDKEYLDDNAVDHIHL